MAEKDSDRKAEMLNAIDVRRGASLSRQSDAHTSDEVWHHSMGHQHVHASNPFYL